MRSLAGYLLIFFMALFWIFRLVVAFTTSIGVDIGFGVIDANIEMLLLFVTIISFILVLKRNILGAILYLLTYGAYFGTYLFKAINLIKDGNGTINDYGNIFVAFIGIILPLAVLFELLLDKNRREHPVDKKTDWFYKNEQFDRKMDERADKNNYRMY